jgi:hypothetical protein
MEIKPNFFVIGAPKAATTSLSSLLVFHPQAGIVQGKEPNFFSFDQRYAIGWTEYMKLFSHCSGKKAIGDGSTSYSRIRYHPLTVGRIHEHVPEARIIYMVRHPLKRMESGYIEHLCTVAGKDLTSINDAVRRQPMIVDSSRYWEVFDAYRQRFSESRIKVIWFEDYIADQTAVFQDVCRFLEIDDSVVPEFNRELTNSREHSFKRMATLGRSKDQVNTAWDEETRHWVIDQIRDDNCRLLAHFGRPKDFWGDLF